MDQWPASFGQFPPDTALDEQIHTFVRALVRFLHDNRELLRVLMAAEFEHDETLQAVADRISAQFAAGLRTLADDAGHDLMRGRDYNVPDAMVASRATTPMATVSSAHRYLTGIEAWACSALNTGHPVSIARTMHLNMRPRSFSCQCPCRRGHRPPSVVS